MRVLHISGGNLYGGVETMLVTLARYREVLPALEQEFAICFEARLSTELAACGAPVHVLGEVGTRRPFTVWRARRKLRGLLRERQIDVAVCHLPWSQAIFGPAVRDADIPFVFWMHGPARGFHWLELWARLPPDLAICNSSFTSTTLVNLFRNSPFEVVYYPSLASSAAGISASERAAFRAELDTPPTATVIVQVSRMEPWKGQAFLLEALGLLRDLPGWVCWLAGGAQRPRERRYVAALGRPASKLGIARSVRFSGGTQRRAATPSRSGHLLPAQYLPGTVRPCFRRSVERGAPGDIERDRGGARDYSVAAWRTGAGAGAPAM